MSEPYSFNLSILEDNPRAIDYYEPAAFLTWFTNKNFVSFDLNKTFDEYKNYIVAWGKKKNVSKTAQTDLIRDAYVQVLRDIVINYSTEEEKRFITNADFTSNYDLDIILPFFIKKIKQVCLYYVSKREELKTAAVQHNLRGSNFGVESLVKKLIFDAADTSQFYYTSKTAFFPPVSALARDIDIYVEELFDTTTNYFNLNPLSSSNIFAQASPLRQALSSANLIDVDYRFYLNFREAVIDAINQYPFFISSLGTNNFSVNPILSGTEYYYLKNRDFIDYLSGGSDKLKLNLQKALAPKYLANDFYYLSTGTTATQFVSGLLFSVAPPAGAATLNLLNRTHPTVATVPNLNSLYTEYEIGRFFIPTYLGLLIYNTYRKEFAINTEKLQPNKVYIFPDPALIGNVSYNSEYEDPDYPLVFEVDVSWNKISRSNQFLFGDVLSNNYRQLYYGYESQQQDLQKNIAGISKSEDNIQFWTGQAQATWANTDNWPDLKSAESYDYASRQQSLMVNDKTLVKWSSDVFNNEYGLYKKVSQIKSISAVEDDSGILPGSSTAVASAPEIQNKNIYEKKNTEPGELYFRNNFNSIVSPASAALSAIYFKYPTPVFRELNNQVYKFNVYGDVILLETENYVVIDKILFDYDTQKVKPTFTPGRFFYKATYNNKIEAFVNEWYAEDTNNLYLCFLRMRPSLSASNYKAVYPSIYRCNLNNLAIKQIYPPVNANLQEFYSLSAGFIEPPQIDIRNIDGAHFSRVERTNTFNLTYLAKNNNSIPFFVNEQFVQTEPYLTSTTPKLFKPFYFTYDNNYANPGLPFLVKYNASTGGIMGTHDRQDYFNIGQQDTTKNVYYFNDSISPTQVNSTGVSYIQFDWQSYEITTVFVGCSAFLIKQIGDNLVWDYTTPSALVLSEFNKSYFISYCEAMDAGGNTFNASIHVRRPVYPDTSVIEVIVTALTGDQTGTICQVSDSIYNTLDVYVSGTGQGIVYSDPFCIYCGDYCSETFATNTTLNLIASGSRITKFVGWDGGPCHSSTIPDCFVTVTSHQSITAVFELLPIYTVSVYNPIGSFGRVRSYDGFIDCPGQCTYTSYLVDDLVVLSAVNPVSGYHMFGFIGAPIGSVIDGNTCSFFITNNIDITANYVRVYDYSVAVTLDATSAVNVANYGKVASTPAGIDCGSTCAATFSGTENAVYGGTNLILSAVPVYGYAFKQWINGPCDGSTNSNCNFTVGQTYNDIIAQFDLGYYTLTVQYSGNGTGIFASNELGITYTNSLSGETKTFSVLNGTTFSINMSGAPSNDLLGIFGATCAGYGVSSCFLTMDSDKTIVATLTTGVYFVLNVFKQGTGCGTVSSADGRILCGSSCSSIYINNNTVELGYLPLSAGCTFGKFYGNGIFFKYDAGTGINLGITPTTLNNGEFFGLIDDSIVITNAAEGAGYAPGDGVTFSCQDCYVSMTATRNVSAIFA